MYPIERYLNIQITYYPAFAGDGRSLFFLSNLTGTAQAWRVALNDEAEIIPWPEQLTFGEDRLLWLMSSPAAGDDRLLVARDSGGNENAQLFLMEPDDGRETALTPGQEAAMHLPGEWSPDGRALLFAANRRDPGLYDLYRLDLDGGEAKMVWRNDAHGQLNRASRHPKAERVAFIRAGQSAAHDLLEIDLDSGEARQLNPTGWPARFESIAYSREGRQLYVLTDLNSDFLHIARLDLASLQWEKLVMPNWDVELMALSPNGRYLAYTINVEGASRLELIDLATGLARSGPIAMNNGPLANGTMNNEQLTVHHSPFSVDNPPFTIHHSPLTINHYSVIGWWDGTLAFSPDSQKLAFSATSPTQTSDIYIWDLDLNSTDELRQATRSSHGGIPVERFVTPQLIRYPTFDGRDIPAWYFPAEIRDWRLETESPAVQPPISNLQSPAIIIVHGGPESQMRPYFHFLAQYLAHNGYAVLAPNVRGSTGYGNAYSHLDDVEQRMDSVTDLAHAAYWLKERPEIDGDKLVVYGASYGGFMVLAALTNYPDLWAAGVELVGISNFVTFLENTSDYRRAHRESEYGSLAHDRDFLQSISPLNHLDKITAPLMVIHGANDPRVPVSEARQLAVALESRGIPVQLLIFDDEGHGIVRLKNKLVAYPAVVTFLQKTLESSG
jgi:dipeptidyl aminopeptidase/acylaminoacyl peptidase